MRQFLQTILKHITELLLNLTTCLAQDFIIFIFVREYGHCQLSLLCQNDMIGRGLAVI